MPLQLKSSPKKRPRDTDVQPSSDSSASASPPTSSSSPSLSTTSDEMMPSGSCPVKQKPDQPSNFALPYSSDLARLPLFYELFGDNKGFTPQSQPNVEWFMGSQSYLPSNEIPYQTGSSSSYPGGNPVMISGAPFASGVSQDNQASSSSGGFESAPTNIGLGPLDLEQFFPIDPNQPNEGPMMDNETLAAWSNTPGLLE